MKREVKFRAWDSISKKIHRWDIIKTMALFQFQSLDHYTLMQYTGLKDKNGVEIYEGDIVRYSNDKPYQVFFKECCFCFYLPANNHILRLRVFNEKNKYEVIGNIHENPELIN